MAEEKTSCYSYTQKLFCYLSILFLATLPFLLYNILPEPEEDPLCLDANCAEDPQDIDEENRPISLKWWLFEFWLTAWKKIVYWGMFVYVIGVFLQIYDKILAIIEGHDDSHERELTPFEKACQKFGALVIVFPKEHVYSEHASRLLELEAISYGIKTAVVPYDEFDPKKLLLTKHVVFVVPGTQKMQPEIDRMIENLDNPEFVQDAFIDLKYGVLYPKEAEVMVKKLSATVESHKATLIQGSSLEPIEWNHIRDFRSWTNKYWSHNLLDITRVQLFNRTLKPNPLYEQEVIEDEPKETRRRFLTPYTGAQEGKLVYKEPVEDKDGYQQGWEIGVHITKSDTGMDSEDNKVSFDDEEEKRSKQIKVGLEVLLLCPNIAEDVEFLCKRLHIDPDEQLCLTNIAHHFPDPLCPNITSPREAFTYYYDIYSPVSGIMYNTLSFFAIGSDEIIKLSSAANDYLTFGKSPYSNIVELLKDFNSIDVSFTDLIMILPRIQCKTGFVHEIVEGEEEGEMHLNMMFVDHDESSLQPWKRHIEYLEADATIVFQTTGIVNSNYLHLPKLTNNKVIIFVEDNGVQFLLTFISSLHKPVDWHIVTRHAPEHMCYDGLSAEYEDGKVSGMITYSLPGTSEHPDIKSLDEKHNLSKLIKEDTLLCLITKKESFEHYRKGAQKAWNLNRRKDRWIEIDVDLL